MIDVIEFRGWTKNLRLSNGEAEVVTTLEVGPRIISFRKSGGPSPFNIFAEQAGRSGETEWQIRGGHRLWVAPEHRTETYSLDNAPVAWTPLGESAARLTPPNDPATGLQKQLDIVLDPHGTRVTIVHRITRTGKTAVSLAPWALTVMKGGGIAVMPQPELGEHPRDLAPNRTWSIWPYTDLSDPRWHIGRRFLSMRHDASRGPTKLGLVQAAGWGGYFVDAVFFRKTFPWQRDATYTDGGCNFETFADQRMLELESLGPLTRLAPGESVEHAEQWELHDAPRSIAFGAEQAIADFLRAINSERAPVAATFTR